MKMTLEDVQQCADERIATGTTCGGCQYDSVCGINDHNRAALAKLLDAVDPQGLNITTIGLGPLGAPPEHGDLTENARRAKIRLGVF